MEMEFDPPLDKGIEPAVLLLNKYGYETLQSCQGGEGHAYPYPTIDFRGNEFDLMEAYEICKAHNMIVYEAKRVYDKIDVYDSETNKSVCKSWQAPYNQITFLIDEGTGTIFFSD